MLNRQLLAARIPLAAALVLLCLAQWASASEQVALPNPFFTYCIGIGTTKEAASLPSQLELAKMQKDLGYAGLAHVGLDGALEMLAALEENGQKLFAVYTPVSVDPDQKGYDPRLMELLPKLKGHGTVIWLVVNSQKYKPSTTPGDDRAVALLREIAAAAEQAGLSISLYPHKGSYAERMEDVVRLAKLVDRRNVGVTFTYCHFLAVDDERNLDRVLEMARPYLNMVTINGTSGYDPKDRSGWILTLDQGTYDVARVLTTLKRLDYRGPIGIIAYGIRGDFRDILERTMKAWKALSAKAAR